MKILTSIAVSRLFSPSNAGSAGPNSFDDNSIYWPRTCTLNKHCWAAKFTSIWPGSDVRNLMCNQADEHCTCKFGTMDTDNDPTNGCEHQIDEENCYYGSCDDHGTSEGSHCATAFWGDLLTCQNGCCVMDSSPVVDLSVCNFYTNFLGSQWTPITLSFGTVCARVIDNSGVNWYQSKAKCEALGATLPYFKAKQDKVDLYNFFISSKPSYDRFHLAYRHNAPVADPEPFTNTATGEKMEWFAVNDYADYYYYEAYYDEFYDGSDYDRDGICTGYPGLKFNSDVQNIVEYSNAEGCFLPNSHCTVENTHSTLCVTNPTRLSAGTALHDDLLDCVDHCRVGTVFARDPWGYTYCHITNCLQDKLDAYCQLEAGITCDTAEPVKYARFSAGRWTCVAHLTVDILPVNDDLTNIPIEDLSLHEMACVDATGALLNCQPAGNAATHHDGAALHCDQHDALISLIETNKNCGSTTQVIATTTATVTTNGLTTTPTPESCVDSENPSFCPDWHSCYLESAECLEDPSICPTLPISWKSSKYSTVVMKGIGAYAIRMNLANLENEYDIRSSPYTGFMIWSRRFCGVEFTNGLISGQIKMMIMDYEAAYEIQYMYERVDKQRSSITVQYKQTHMPQFDLPLIDGVNNQKKDQFYLYLYDMQDILVKDEEKCFQVALGVLPTNLELIPTNFVDLNDDFTLCAGWQKDVGF